MGGLNSAQKLFLLILTIVTVISISLTLLAYQLVPSLRTQTAKNDPAGTPTSTAVTIADTPTPTPTQITPTPTPHKSTPTPTPTPVRPTPTPTPKPPVTITILIQNSTDNAFKPKTVTVPPGSTIIFKNISSIPHTATGTKFDTGNIEPGAKSKPIKLTKPGTYQYVCTYHPNMVGTIIVQ
jgi:plastocyanin